MNTQPPTQPSEVDELFELCKEVSDLTGWQIERWFCYSDKKGWTVSDYAHGEKWVSAYNSDYLLEKLPEEYEGDNFSLSIDTDPHERGKWEAGYEDLFVNADTPLKALLKLTIALHEANALTPTTRRKDK